MAPEELTAPPEASQGVVGPAIRPHSTPVEEIVRAEPRTQSIRILRRRGDSVVVVEEEDTPKDIRRLKSTLAGVIKQIEVTTESRAFIIILMNFRE
jgi:hypothetical protein